MVVALHAGLGADEGAAFDGGFAHPRHELVILVEVEGLGLVDGAEGAAELRAGLDERGADEADEEDCGECGGDVALGWRLGVDEGEVAAAEGGGEPLFEACACEAGGDGEVEGVGCGGDAERGQDHEQELQEREVAEELHALVEGIEVDPAAAEESVDEAVAGCDGWVAEERRATDHAEQREDEAHDGGAAEGRVAEACDGDDEPEQCAVGEDGGGGAVEEVAGDEGREGLGPAVAIEAFAGAVGPAAEVGLVLEEGDLPGCDEGEGDGPRAGEFLHGGGAAGHEEREDGHDGDQRDGIEHVAAGGEGGGECGGPDAPSFVDERDEFTEDDGERDVAPVLGVEANIEGGLDRVAEGHTGADLGVDDEGGERTCDGGGESVCAGATEPEGDGPGLQGDHGDGEELVGEDGHLGPAQERAESCAHNVWDGLVVEAEGEAEVVVGGPPALAVHEELGEGGDGGGVARGVVAERRTGAAVAARRLEDDEGRDEEDGDGGGAGVEFGDPHGGRLRAGGGIRKGHATGEKREHGA